MSNELNFSFPDIWSTGGSWTGGGSGGVSWTWECPNCRTIYPQQQECPNCKDKITEDSGGIYFIIPDDLNLTPNQLREMQDTLRAVAEEMGIKEKFVVLPPRSKVVSEKNV